jgi:hypothetical protein
MKSSRLSYKYRLRLTKNQNNPNIRQDAANALANPDKLEEIVKLAKANTK